MNLDLTASILDSSVNAGAPRVDSVYFSISPEKHMELKNQLLEKAVNNAKTRATKSLAPLDQKIVGVQSVSIAEFGMPYPEPVYRMEAVMGDSISALAAPTLVFSSKMCTPQCTLSSLLEATNFFFYKKAPRYTVYLIIYYKTRLFL